MKRRDELIVGATILFALVVVFLGAVWLSQAQLGSHGLVQGVRFRTVGGLGVNNPVVLRGVRVGRVLSIEIPEGSSDWVEAQLQIYEDAVNKSLIPKDPAIIAASASLFGEWQVEIISMDDPPDDPNVVRDLEEAADEGGDLWPGATLPDIGQLTAQAGRIATDIATFSNRISTAFDSQTVLDVQRSIRDLSVVADTLTGFTEHQTQVLGEVSARIHAGADAVQSAAIMLERTLSRVDTATSDGKLDSIVTNLQAASAEMKAALENFRQLLEVAHDNQQSFVRVVVGADSIMTRLQNMSGTLGLLFGDSALYVQSTDAVTELRDLIADIKANPRKYFKFSVF
ncbi:MAG: MlaD family protein [Gemmatimonadales bacterium]